MIILHWKQAMTCDKCNSHTYLNHVFRKNIERWSNSLKLENSYQCFVFYFWIKINKINNIVFFV